MPAPAYYAHLAAFHARVHVTNGKYEAFHVFCDIRLLSNCARTKKVSFFALGKKKSRRQICPRNFQMAYFPSFICKENHRFLYP